MKYHINRKGDVGKCTAVVACPFGDFDKDHYDTPEAARAAYEAKMSAPAYTRFTRGKKLSRGDLDSLPTGAVVRWTKYDGAVKSYVDYSKQETGTWMESSGLSARQVQATYLAGASGNEKATFVSHDGQSSEDLGPEPEKKERAKPAAKWAIIRVSNVTGKVYLDHSFAREAQAEKKLSELNRHDHLHHAYELVPMAEALSRKTD